MQITIDQSALSRELALVAGAAAKASTIPILATVRMEAQGDTLRLTATDLECGITASVPAQVAEGGAICLPVTRLLALIKALPAGNIAISVDDKQYATIRAGRSRTRIPGDAVTGFPDLPAVPEPSASIDARGFARILARVAFAISAEESRFTTNGALLEITDSQVRAVATDGHRLAFAEAEGATASVPLKTLLPKRAITHYAKLADAAEGGARVEVATDDNHIFLSVCGRQLTARKLVGNFPDYARVLPKHKQSVTVGRAELKGALDRVAQFADERSRAVRFTFRDSELSMNAASGDSGEAEESIACEGSTALEIGINAEYVAEFLGAASGDRIQVFTLDGKSAVEMRPMKGAGTEQDPYAETSDYKYICMPMRI